MQTSQRPWSDIQVDLVERIQSCTLTTPALAKASGANYHAVRRIRQGKAAKRAKNAKLLCIYFDIDMELCKVQSEKGQGLIANAVKQNWDGTDEHARLIAELIQSTANYVVKLRT